MSAQTRCPLAAVIWLTWTAPPSPAPLSGLRVRLLAPLSPGALSDPDLQPLPVHGLSLQPPSAHTVHFAFLGPRHGPCQSLGLRVPPALPGPSHLHRAGLCLRCHEDNRLARVTLLGMAPAPRPTVAPGAGRFLYDYHLAVRLPKNVWLVRVCPPRPHGPPVSSSLNGHHAITVGAGPCGPTQGPPSLPTAARCPLRAPWPPPSSPHRPPLGLPPSLFLPLEGSTALLPTLPPGLGFLPRVPPVIPRALATGPPCAGVRATGVDRSDSLP